MQFRLLLIVSLFFVFCAAKAQKEDPRQIRKNGISIFEKANYQQALLELGKYHELQPGDVEVKLFMGICHYHLNQTSQADRYFKYIIENEKSPNPDAFLYLGKTHHARHQFRQAAQFYKSFLKNAPKNNLLRPSVIEEIRRCGNGIHLQRNVSPAIVENLGEKVNSSDDEFGPILSPNFKDRLYFSSKRKKLGVHSNEKFANPYSTTVINGEWSGTHPVKPPLAGPFHEILLDFNEAGDQLFYFRGNTLFSGLMLVDTFKMDASANPPAQQEAFCPLKTWEGDGSPYFFKDSILLFSSRRAGGFGGLDLYISILRSGKWTAAENLGATINSSFDETSPFLAKDGRTLYFSSNNSKTSMGGLDIFKTTYSDYFESWTKPENLQSPINSAGDEAYFRLTDNGTKAYFSSSRKSGFGQRDLYVAYFSSLQKAQAFQSIPLVFYQVASYKKMLEKLGATEALTQTQIPVPFPDEGITSFDLETLYYESEAPILSSENIRKINLLLHLLKKYPQLKVSLTAHTDNTTSSDYALYFSIKKAEKVGTYLVENGINPANILLKGLGGKYPIAKNEIDEKPNALGQALNRRIDINVHNAEGLPISLNVKKKAVQDWLAVSDSHFVQMASIGLSYKVQIAALKQFYNGDFIKNFPHAMIETIPETGMYQYTVGLYQTFQSADELRKDIIQHGTNEAFIVAYLNGFRITTAEVENYARAFPDLEKMKR